MAKFKNISPLVPVGDVLTSVKFFEDYLGFRSNSKSSEYAHLERDSVSLKLQKAGANVGQLACYIDVEGIDRLYGELEAKLDTLPKGRVRPPFNQEYGMREFHVIDLDNLLIFFGEPINSET
jgi:hypothetical protein